VAILETRSFLTRPGRGREVLRSTIEWRHRQGDHDLRVDRLEQRNGRFAVAISWAERAERDGTRHEWAHALRLRDGAIIDMEDYASGAKAVRALRRGRLKP
jgi:ketosteroid isomerase-like protein